MGHLPASPTNNDHDLWEHAHDLVTQATAKGLLIKVAKVKSHVDAESLPDRMERCAVRGNHQADILAEQTRAIFPPGFWPLWGRLRLAYQQKVTWAETIFRLFAAVGQKAQMSKNSTPDQPNTAAETAPQGDAEIHAISFDPLPPWEARDTSVQLGDVGHVFHTWLKALLSDSSVAPQWISSYQLLLRFQQFTKTIGPTCIRKNWTSWES